VDIIYIIEKTDCAFFFEMTGQYSMHWIGWTYYRNYWTFYTLIWLNRC